MSELNIKQYRVAGGMRVASSCDPIYGLRPEIITRRITPENWETKAMWRTALTGPVYLFVDYNPDSSQPGGPLAYKVLVYLYDLEGNELNSYAESCTDLEAAISCANGEGRTALSVLTRPTEPEECPLKKPAPVFFASVRGRGRL